MVGLGWSGWLSFKATKFYLWECLFLSFSLRILSIFHWNFHLALPLILPPMVTNGGHSQLLKKEVWAYKFWASAWMVLNYVHCPQGKWLCGKVCQKSDRESKQAAVFFFCCCYFFFLGGGVTARQDYFTHFEPIQSTGGVKTGDPWQKPPDHMQAELGLSYMWPELGSNPQQWDDEKFRVLKISGLSHSATGAARSWILMSHEWLGRGEWTLKDCRSRRSKQWWFFIKELVKSCV